MLRMNSRCFKLENNLLKVCALSSTYSEYKSDNSTETWKSVRNDNKDNAILPSRKLFPPDAISSPALYRAGGVITAAYKRNPKNSLFLQKLSIRSDRKRRTISRREICSRRTTIEPGRKQCFSQHNHNNFSKFLSLLLPPQIPYFFLFLCMYSCRFLRIWNVHISHECNIVFTQYHYIHNLYLECLYQ